MRIAIYSRVSTDRQETENQLIEMREYCRRQGYEITHEFVDFDVSASKTPLWERKQGRLLLKGIQNREMQLNKIEYGFIMSLGRAINPKYSIAKEIAKRQSYLIEIIIIKYTQLAKMMKGTKS